MALYPVSPDGSQANFYMDRGLFLLQAKRYADARQQFALALGEDPDNPLGHVRMGVTLCELKQVREAIPYAQEAIRLGADNPLVMQNAAWILQRDERFDEAEKTVREAIRMAPEYADAYSLLASILYRLLQKQEALEMANKAIELDPSDGYSHRLKGIILRDLGFKDEADKALKEAIRQDPENPWTHHFMGLAQADYGDLQAAEYHFRESLRIDPNIEDSRMSLHQAKIATTPIGKLHNWGRDSAEFVLVFFVLLLGVGGGIYASKVDKVIPMALAPITGQLILASVIRAIVDPLGVCWLSLTSQGRQLFSRWEIRSSWFLFGFLLLYLGIMITGMALASQPMVLVALLLAFAYLPISEVCRTYSPRIAKNCIIFTLVAIPFGIFCIVLTLTGDESNDYNSSAFAWAAYFALTAVPTIVAEVYEGK
ncbi:tetratricopeptide repeat protein [Bremerella sp. JC817]|uniref:tetratricopeptide repeat protein n=1 Tax=Bremerella sp. JC817 TaxID=3231756 RepID=UPI0034578C61